MKWFRMYVDAINNPKTATLPADVFRAWILCLAVSAELESDGVLPDVEELGFRTRLQPGAVEPLLTALERARLIERQPDGSRRIYRWSQYQFSSDNAARRMRERRASQPSPPPTAPSPHPSPAVAPKPDEAAIGLNSAADVDRVTSIALEYWPKHRTIRARCSEWVACHPAARVVDALTIAREAGANSPKYVDKILASPPPEPAESPSRPRRRKAEPDSQAQAARNAEITAKLKHGVPEW